AAGSAHRRKFHIIKCLTGIGVHVTLSSSALSQRRTSGLSFARRGRRIRLLTFGYVAFALQAQGGPGSGTGGIDYGHLLADASPLAKSVLLILLLFSAVSWAITLSKSVQYRRAARDSDTF